SAIHCVPRAHVGSWRISVDGRTPPLRPLSARSGPTTEAHMAESQRQPPPFERAPLPSDAGEERRRANFLPPARLRGTSQRAPPLEALPRGLDVRYPTISSSANQ